MLRRIANFLKRAELATDLMVLERDPHSRRAAEIRAKHAKAAFEHKVNKAVVEDAERFAAAFNEVYDKNSNLTGADQIKEIERRMGR